MRERRAGEIGGRALDQVKLRDAVVEIAREAVRGDDPEVLQAALDELNAATQGLALQLMNAAARAALKDRRMEEVSPDNL